MVSAEPVVSSWSDYYAFGWEMPGRTSVSSPSHRYGFNGQEVDKEWLNGVAIAYKFRIHDPRLGRFLSLDPLGHEQNWNSPYSFAENSPIVFIDIMGLQGGKGQKRNKKNRWPEQKAAIKQTAESIKDAVLNGSAQLSTRFPTSVLTGVTYLGRDMFGTEIHKFGYYYYDKETNEFKHSTFKNDVSVEDAQDILLVMDAIAMAGEFTLAIRAKDLYKISSVVVKSSDEIVEGMGIVYRRIDKTTGKVYIGQAKNEERFIARQAEHAENNPLAEYEFEVIGQAKEGKDLNVLEETLIRKHGVPSTKKSTANGTGTLENKRYQMSEKNYNEAGGTQKKQPTSY